MRIDIWSDIVCPWCYVGKRRFETALAAFPAREAVQVVHHSFQLNPGAPADYTTDRRDMLMRKYRLTTAQVNELDARMTETAEAEGLEYHLDATVSGNTFDAHQMIHLAASHGRQDAMVERLYRAYFTEQRSIFDHASLTALAGDVGLDPTEAGEALRTRRFAAAVEQDVAAARQLGVSGVPFFVIGERYGVSGAQSAEVLLEVLNKASMMPSP